MGAWEIRQLGDQTMIVMRKQRESELLLAINLKFYRFVCSSVFFFFKFESLVKSCENKIPDF